MSPRPVLPWPHPLLREPTHPVDHVDDTVHRLWSEMIEVMEAMPGVGLAAPQIGETVSVCVVDASDERGQVIRMANPELIAFSEAQSDYEEASPNLPGVHAKIRRPEEVTVRFLNAEGTIEERALAGLWARSVQHQIDHLAGLMYFDRLSRTRRAMLLKKARKVAP